MIDREKRTKTLSEEKPAKNVSNNPQSFLEMNPVQNEDLLLHKLQDHAYQL